nr:hypothetical protein [Tanacetum cinerariifolium]
DSTVTYTFVHSEARSWSIPSVDPYEEAAQKLLEQAPRSPEYVPDPIELEDHLPKRLLLTAPTPGCEVEESSPAASRQPGPTMACSVDCSFVDTMETSRESSKFYSRHHDAQKDRAAVRAEIQILRRERLA